MCVAQDYPNKFFKTKAGFQGTTRDIDFMGHLNLTIISEVGLNEARDRDDIIIILFLRHLKPYNKNKTFGLTATQLNVDSFDHLSPLFGG